MGRMLGMRRPVFVVAAVVSTLSRLLTHLTILSALSGRGVCRIGDPRARCQAVHALLVMSQYYCLVSFT
jgi:hypothetical protein